MKRSYSASVIGRSSVTLKRSKHTLSSCEISAGDSKGNNKCSNSSSSNSSSGTDFSDNDNVIGKVDDIDSFKKEQELSLCNCTSYHNNIELNDNMRAILIDWLTEIAELYKLHTNTIHLAIGYIDTITRKKYVQISQYQLVGTACLVIACKFDDSKTPSFTSLVSLANYDFDSDDLVMMEKMIINELDFGLHVPTRDYFSRRLSIVAKLNEKEAALLEFITELSLRDSSLNLYRMSLVSAAAVHYVYQCLRKKNTQLWTSELETYTGYRECELVPIVLRLAKLHSELDSNKTSKNFLQKYQRPSYHSAGYTIAISVTKLRFGIRVNIDNVLNQPPCTLPTLPLYPSKNSSNSSFGVYSSRNSFDNGYFP